ncbi:MAG: DUF2087 domain-containing protein [Acidimicrobiia bacterium]|nr:DUF2087 domain-containing protein [Acidimicrobiia bacterium]
MLPPSAFLRIALDPIRLAVLGRAAAGPVEIEALAEALGEHPRRVLKAVGGLREAGLLTASLELDREALRGIAAALPQMDTVDPAFLEGPWTEEEGAVLSRFFSGTRLTQIPASHGKRRLVLERLATEFEPGLRYGEKEVNLMLEAFHEDYTSLRRYLIDEGFLSRDGGVYWRTGGRS